MPFGFPNAKDEDKAPDPAAPNGPLTQGGDPLFQAGDINSRHQITAGFINDPTDPRISASEAASAATADVLPAGSSASANASARAQLSRVNFATAGFDAQRRQLEADADELATATAAVDRLRESQTVTQKDLDKMNQLSFAENANTASAEFLQHKEASDAMLGITGLGGGVAAAAAANLEGQRFNTIVNAQRASEMDNFWRFADSKFKDSMALFGAEMGLAGVQGKDVPTLDVETTEALLEADLAELGIYMGAEAAEKKRKSDERAANISAGVGIANMIFGLIL